MNTADEGGGAEHASITALNGFLSLGLDAWLLVGRKTGTHQRVVSFYSSPLFDYRPYADSGLLKEVERWRIIDQSMGIEDFNHPYSRHITEMTGAPPDLVLCHNLHSGYFDLRVLATLSNRMPVAVRLFDSWLQTGHCAYSLGCNRWQSGCGRCPDLTIPPAISQDASGINLRRKQRIFAASRFSVSAESQWMLDQAKRSVLAPAVSDWRHIPGAVDLEVFYPGARATARQQLDLDPDVSLLLYVANQGAANPYKDFETVRRSLHILRQRLPTRKTLLLVIGGVAPDQEIGPDIRIHHVGYLASRQRLAAFYRAANVMVHAAVEETFGNVVAEALACGTPVVAASGGGVLELVEHGLTGLIVPPGNPAQLADAISHLLDAPALCARMGTAAAAAARSRLDCRVMIRSLQSWCSEVHAAWHARAAG